MFIFPVIQLTYFRTRHVHCMPAGHRGHSPGGVTVWRRSVGRRESEMSLEIFKWLVIVLAECIQIGELCDTPMTLTSQYHGRGMNWSDVGKVSGRSTEGQ